jgi:anti-anti-sigma factor
MPINTANEAKFCIVSTDETMLDSSIAPDLKATFLKINGDNTNRILLDLSNVKYCDSSGLSAILIGHRLCRDSGGNFVLCGLQNAVSKIISIAQLDKVFSIADNLDDAKSMLKDRKSVV